MGARFGSPLERCLDVDHADAGSALEIADCPVGSLAGSTILRGVSGSGGAWLISRDAPSSCPAWSRASVVGAPPPPRGEAGTWCLERAPRRCWHPSPLSRTLQEAVVPDPARLRALRDVAAVVGVGETDYA